MVRAVIYIPGVTPKVLNLGNWVQVDAVGNIQVKGLQEVGKYPGGKSFYGVYDMLGNVSEWTSDIYNADFYRTAPLRNPFNNTASATSTAEHSKRGGVGLPDQDTCITPGV